jgi:hypothetical protein
VVMPCVATDFVRGVAWTHGLLDECAFELVEFVGGEACVALSKSAVQA